MLTVLMEAPKGASIAFYEGHALVARARVSLGFAGTLARRRILLPESSTHYSIRGALELSRRLVSGNRMSMMC